MNIEVTDRLAIRDLIDNWALWRDAGDGDRFATVWADDSWMSATWFQGTGSDFIRVTIEGWNKGVSILHFLGGTTIDLAGTRAWVQTKMTISSVPRSTEWNATWLARAAFMTCWKSATAIG